MNRNDLINATVDDGIEEVRERFREPNQQLRREGAVAGFEACRGLDDKQLLALLEKAKADTLAGLLEEAADYWYTREKEAQIEFTLNVLSAAMHAHGQKPLIPPTYFGFRKAVSILNGEPIEEVQ